MIIDNSTKLWVVGATGSGKTTLAHAILVKRQKQLQILDADASCKMHHIELDDLHWDAKTHDLLL